MFLRRFQEKVETHVSSIICSVESCGLSDNQREAKFPSFCIQQWFFEHANTAEGPCCR